jgi:hypothetical protein
MLDDLSVLESEDVDADLWPEDVVLGVGEDVVAILEDPDRVDVRALGDGFEQRVKARHAVSGSQVVLNVVVGVNHPDGLGRASSDGFQQIDDLLLLGGHDGSFC